MLVEEVSVSQNEFDAGQIPVKNEEPNLSTLMCPLAAGMEQMLDRDKAEILKAFITFHEEVSIIDIALQLADDGRTQKQKRDAAAYVILRKKGVGEFVSLITDLPLGDNGKLMFKVNKEEKIKLCQEMSARVFETPVAMPKSRKKPKQKKVVYKPNKADAYIAPSKPHNYSTAEEDPRMFPNANCREVDSDLFFPVHGESSSEAKEVCRGCVVREECLEYALQNGEKFGIWGGLSERERRRVRRQRLLSRKMAQDVAEDSVEQ
jgi:WhiB family redox-sensing transcriptional regulator